MTGGARGEGGGKGAEVARRLGVGGRGWLSRGLVLGAVEERGESEKEVICPSRRGRCGWWRPCRTERRAGVEYANGNAHRRERRGLGGERGQDECPSPGGAAPPLHSGVSGAPELPRRAGRGCLVLFLGGGGGWRSGEDEMLDPHTTPRRLGVETHHSTLESGGPTARRKRAVGGEDSTGTTPGHKWEGEGKWVEARFRGR